MCQGPGVERTIHLQNKPISLQGRHTQVLPFMSLPTPEVHTSANAAKLSHLSLADCNSKPRRGPSQGFWGSSEDPHFLHL